MAVGVPLADALDAHRRELAIPEVDAFAGALARAVRHGAPLADTLAAQAREVRLARRRAIQEQAARAGPKMQLVVALLLVPSVMLLVAAALLSALADGGGRPGFGWATEPQVPITSARSCQWDAYRGSSIPLALCAAVFATCYRRRPPASPVAVDDETYSRARARLPGSARRLRGERPGERPVLSRARRAPSPRRSSSSGRSSWPGPPT